MARIKSDISISRGTFEHKELTKSGGIYVRINCANQEIKEIIVNVEGGKGRNSEQDLYIPRTWMAIRLDRIVSVKRILDCRDLAKLELQGNLEFFTQSTADKINGPDSEATREELLRCMKIMYGDNTASSLILQDDLDRVRDGGKTKEELEVEAEAETIASDISNAMIELENPEGDVTVTQVCNLIKTKMMSDSITVEELTYVRTKAKASGHAKLTAYCNEAIKDLNDSSE